MAFGFQLCKQVTVLQDGSVNVIFGNLHSSIVGNLDHVFALATQWTLDKNTIDIPSVAFEFSDPSNQVVARRFIAPFEIVNREYRIARKAIPIRGIGPGIYQVSLHIESPNISNLLPFILLPRR